MSPPKPTKFQCFLVSMLFILPYALCVSEGGASSEESSGVGFDDIMFRRPPYLGFPNNDKRSMTLGRFNFRPGKRSIDLTPDLAFEAIPDDSFLAWDTGMGDEKRAGLHFGHVRMPMLKRLPTMQEVDSLEGMAPYGSHGFSLLTEAQMGKRTAALGRWGFRPAKRSMAVGRSRFRPGKRSIATGRAGFRPGKRGGAYAGLPETL